MIKPLVSLAVVLLAGRGARADTFHVATTGDDAAAGGSASPWRTIQRAADAVAAGDTVVIHAGGYSGFVVTARGTAASPIVFAADGAVSIDGGASVNRDAVHLVGAAWVRIEGLTVTGARRAGIGAEDCEHITVRGNRIDANARWGVFSSFCEDLVVEDNEVSRSGTEHGIYASNSADRPVIRRNVVWGNGGCGIHINGDINFGGDGVISAAVVEGNTIVDNGRLGGSGINADGVVGATIRNNVLDGNHASGISLYRIDGGVPSTDNAIVNNTIRMASDARWAVNIQDGSIRNVVRNNVLLDPAPASGAINACADCLAGMDSDHNVVVGRFSVGGAIVDLAGWRARTGGDASSFVATDAELFTDAAAGELSLRAGSPAIDRGVAAGAPSYDIDGVARPQGAAVDIGAYERAAGEPEPEPGEPEPMPDDPIVEDTSSGGCAADPRAGWLVALAAVAFLRRRRRR